MFKIAKFNDSVLGVGDAEAAYQRAIQLDPGMALLYSDLGYLYPRQGRYGEAQRLLEQALSLDPNLVLAQNNLAEWRRLLALQNSALVGGGGGFGVVTQG